METPGDYFVRNLCLGYQVKMRSESLLRKHTGEDFLQSHSMAAGFPCREEVTGAMPRAVAV